MNETIQRRARWAALRQGEVWKVLAQQALLESRGIPTWVPDSDAKVIDPFVTGGGNALLARLMVPNDQLERADAILRDDEAARPPLAADEQPDAPRRSRVDSLGRYIRWSALFPLFALFGVYHALAYFPLARAADEPPRHHGWTTLGAALCVLWSLAQLGILTQLLLAS